ncbi:uncharacterized protein BYT42DRAFT_561573 [Radiomyces spectabilis]|uniref:uncharacterized protein n=1 Tax=Radiomyces spectabilis TaxID=64574 RepID=UPI00221F4583|nr:uncharacterized protein BYT42DRAFT_561573 [Radiomyces spectabilis]KAI8388872.1 hypothetical protein BYT42DRAFT_561573 [Radiomyces spectabilis]
MPLHRFSFILLLITLFAVAKFYTADAYPLYVPALARPPDQRVFSIGGAHHTPSCHDNEDIVESESGLMEGEDADKGYAPFQLSLDYLVELVRDILYRMSSDEYAEDMDVYDDNSDSEQDMEAEPDWSVVDEENISATLLVSSSDLDDNFIEMSMVSHMRKARSKMTMDDLWKMTEGMTSGTSDKDDFDYHSDT